MFTKLRLARANPMKSLKIADATSMISMIEAPTEQNWYIHVDYLHPVHLRYTTLVSHCRYLNNICN
jgi:uncharacterized protein (DUF427 family)